MGKAYFILWRLVGIGEHVASCFPLHYALRCKYVSAAQLCFILSTRLSMPFWKTKAHELLCKTYLVRCRCDFCFIVFCMSCYMWLEWFLLFCMACHAKEFWVFEDSRCNGVTVTPFAAPFADHHNCHVWCFLMCWIKKNIGWLDYHRLPEYHCLSRPWELD